MPPAPFAADEEAPTSTAKSSFTFRFPIKGSKTGMNITVHRRPPPARPLLGATMGALFRVLDFPAAFLANSHLFFPR